MKTSAIRCNYRVKNKLILFFSEYKIVLMASALFLILGAVLGVFTAIKYSGELELSNLSDSNLVDFLKGDKSTTGLLFPYIFSFLFCSCLIIFFNFKPFLSCITFLTLIIKSYLICFDVTVLIVLYGFAGIVNVVLIILPFELVLWCVLVTISAIAIKRNYNFKHFGSCLECKIVGFNYAKMYCFLICVGIISLIIKCLTMPLIRVTIIVN